MPVAHKGVMGAGSWEQKQGKPGTPKEQPWSPEGWTYLCPLSLGLGGRGWGRLLDGYPEVPPFKGVREHVHLPGTQMT